MLVPKACSFHAFRCSFVIALKRDFHFAGRRGFLVPGPGFDDCEEDLAGLEDDEGCGALARMEASVGPTAIHDQNERLSLREKVGSHLVGIVGSNVLDWLLDLS
jgi:hypothetical protein